MGTELAIVGEQHSQHEIPAHFGSEVVLRATDGINAWAKPKPGWTMAGATVGRLVLTNERLLFLSTGTNGVAKALVASLAMGPLGQVMFGQTKTSDLDLSALETRGSFSVPLARLSSCELRKRWDFGMYLSLRYTDDTEQPRVRAVMANTLLGSWKLFRQWHAEIEDAQSRA
jgi:hypothetical protein